MQKKAVLDELQKRYPDITQVMLDDIDGIVASATDYQRGWMWRRFLEEYTYNSPPKPAVFARLLHEAPRSKVKEVVHGCHTCRTSYPVGIQYCPVCGGEMVCVYKGNNFTYINRQCPNCVKFVFKETIGAHCEYWGVGLDGCGLHGDAYEVQKNKCQDCGCKVCCREKRIYKQDFQFYKEMSARGEFKGGFERKASKN